MRNSIHTRLDLEGRSERRLPHEEDSTLVTDRNDGGATGALCSRGGTDRRRHSGHDCDRSRNSKARGAIPRSPQAPEDRRGERRLGVAPRRPGPPHRRLIGLAGKISSMVNLFLVVQRAHAMAQIPTMPYFYPFPSWQTRDDRNSRNHLGSRSSLLPHKLRSARI